ncbi:hypothetical protein CVT24_008333 [Panaeolus cyanescens]|uniref:Ubiquitin-like-conjugating enzyme ATG10 n=1 Tax=Panaeolus cyanescens TaxID=181874 RepID=A0A409VCC1_9AGAR|nr:hypothetical protein CVT24_008333 [Panaeolus cyanescens]
MLTRPQFEQSAKAFARRHTQWRWNSNHIPGYGYLDRTTSHFYRGRVVDMNNSDLEQEGLEEEQDLAAAAPSQSCFTVHEYIVMTYAIFIMRGASQPSDGTALSLNDLVNTTLFKSSLPVHSEVTTFAVTVPATQFPLLSQGDHPTLGIPCWYFHPCETSKAVDEFMVEEQYDDSSEEYYARWMEVWLMIVGSVLNV